MQAYQYFCGIINVKELENPYSNEAIILRKELIVCIIDEFRHGLNGLISRFMKVCEDKYLEMSYTEVAPKISDLLRNTKNKRC
jgi:hypothetical protein